MAQWVESVVRARLLVASLGEDAAAPWWRTEALTPTGLRLLERLFPRTAIDAALETASRAATIEHDSHIGRLRAYHLFRLPIADEMVVRDHLRLPETDALLRQLTGLQVRQDRLDALHGLAGSETLTAVQGPVHCGATNGVRRGKALQRMCAAYAGAFGAGKVVYPYLTEADSL